MRRIKLNCKLSKLFAILIIVPSILHSFNTHAFNDGDACKTAIAFSKIGEVVNMLGVKTSASRSTRQHLTEQLKKDCGSTHRKTAEAYLL